MKSKKVKFDNNLKITYFYPSIEEIEEKRKSCYAIEKNILWKSSVNYALCVIFIFFLVLSLAYITKTLTDAFKRFK